MKFRYKKFGPVIRPVIPIELRSLHRSIRYEVLVDSGADICIFDAEIGELIGLDIKRGKERTVTGVAGQSASYFLHNVEIEVGGHAYEIEAGFLPNVAGDNNYGIVGQQGFFDIFTVKFDFAKEEIEMKEHRS